MVAAITTYGLGHPKNSSIIPYGSNHMTDFLDIWLKDEAFGVDHIIYEDGSVEVRVKGNTLNELPGDNQ